MNFKKTFFKFKIDDRSEESPKLDLDVIQLLFPSLYEELSYKNNDESYDHSELDVYFKFLTRPHENSQNDNLTNFSRIKKSLSQSNPNLFSIKQPTKSRFNSELAQLTLEKLARRSEELIKIVNLIDSFSHIHNQSQISSSAKMNRKSHGNNVSLNFDQLYLLVSEEFLLNINILFYMESANLDLTLRKNQTKKLLQLICTYLTNSLNNNFEYFNSKLNISLCNYILSEIFLNSHLRFSTNKAFWTTFSDIIVNTNFLEICWEIYTFQLQGSITNESILYENSCSQINDDYELNQENLNT